MQENIAVIGSGMAGLATAWILQQAGHRVTVFESQSSRGMDAHTLDLVDHKDKGWIDVPLRVMSPKAWGSVIALAAQVQVGTFGVDTFVSCNWLDQSTWFRSSRLGFRQIPFVGSWRYLNLNTARVLRGLVQVARAIGHLERNPQSELTLAEFAKQQAFDPLFWRGLVLPLLTTICTCSEDHLMAWPARDLMMIFGKILFGDQLLRLKGGTRALVQGLTQDLHFHSGSPVVTLRYEDQKVKVFNAIGQGGLFDRTVIATQANQQSFLDRDMFARELTTLSAIRYDTGDLWVHSDTRFMPRLQRDWTALNYLMHKDFSSSMFTVWVNPVEPSIAQVRPVFQTWNPLFEVAPSKVLSRVTLQRAVVHPGTSQALRQLAMIHAEPDRRVFFCGSWAYPGVPLLESAVRSALAVAERLQIVPSWSSAI